jgi:ATP adenylyltransferase
MERLWSPWRLSYVTGAVDPAPGCIFCDAASYTSGTPQADLVLLRTSLAFVILNRYPYNNGHLMVAPNRHVATLTATDREEQRELMRLTRIAEMALTEAYQPQGINIGVNIGRPAGAGIVDHLHVHLVPRWGGDTSFISVIGETRVLPETLGDTAKRLGPIFDKLSTQN